MTVVIFMTVEGFVAGLLDALDVLPPEVEGDDDGDGGGGEVRARSTGGASPSRQSASGGARPTVKALSRPTMYWPAETPEMGPVRT